MRGDGQLAARVSNLRLYAHSTVPQVARNREIGKNNFTQVKSYVFCT